MKKICAFMIAVMLLLSVCGCTGLTKKEENILRVGIECAYAPYNWETAEKNEYTAEIENHDGFYADGYDVQIAKIIGELTGKDDIIQENKQ